MLLKIRGCGFRSRGPLARPTVAKPVTKLLSVVGIDIGRGNLVDIEDDVATDGVVPEIVGDNARKDYLGELERLASVLELGSEMNRPVLAKDFVGNKTVVVDGDFLAFVHKFRGIPEGPCLEFGRF